ncbi:amidoligase family protein [Lutimaribacter marinistellae]|uniref:Amidoligase family protein n=1 Tax=Lutimaribacter marinistellae TaxID=1820329 RepID=A0ABV7TM39_9RHOB
MQTAASSSDARKRKIGLELEFTGLSESDAAQVFASATAGRAERTEERSWTCETDDFGTCRFFLDTAFDNEISEIGGMAERLMRQVIPVELTTEPFDPTNLPRFDQAIAELRHAGATGSRHGLLLGFGLHLNVDAASEDAEYLSRILTSYALLEAWFRQAAPIDISRRVLPFVTPCPDHFVDTMAMLDIASMDDLISIYLNHVPSRNFGLDLLPILAGHEPHRIEDAVHGEKVKPRPAFHFRLPDCRIDEPDWSVMEAYDQWSMVEAVAADASLLGQLRTARTNWAQRPPLSRPPWFSVVEEVLSQPDRQANA